MARLEEFEFPQFMIESHTSNPSNQEQKPQMQGWLAMAGANLLISAMHGPLRQVYNLLFQQGTAVDLNRSNPLLGQLSSGEGPLASYIESIPALDGTLPDPEDRSPVVFAGCDKAYLTHFAHVLARSLAATAQYPRLHLHIMANYDDDLEPALNSVRRNFNGGTLTFTTEHRNFTDWPVGLDKLYFRCMRFIRMGQMVEKTGHSVVFMDVDNIFLQPLEQILKPVQLLDVAMPMRLWRREPWMRVLAGFVYIAATPLGKAYILAASQAIIESLKRQRQDGFVDQLILYESLSKIDGLRYRSFPADVVLIRDQHRASVLSGRADSKWQQKEIVERRFGLLNGSK